MKMPKKMQKFNDRQKYVSQSVGVTMEVVNYSAWLLFVAEGIDSHFRSLISHLFTDGFASFLLCICKI